MPFVLANILQPLIDVFEAVLKFFHDSVGFGWGLSIIALTVAVRALLLPLAVKQHKSMQAMQRVAPELKALQTKYKDDKQRQQQEVMAFYRENKVNPFASCLPLLAQIPVFISLFYMLQKDLRQDICPALNPVGVDNPKPCGASSASEFFFIPDITDKATGGVLITLLLLYVGSQLLSSVLMASATTDPMQRKIFIVLPFIFVPFILSFPAGLLVYWITTNLWTVGQQFAIRRLLGPMRPPGQDPGPTLSDMLKGKRDELKEASAGGGGAGPKKAATATAGAANGARAAGGSPPPPPRKKKKRSGRRR